MAPDRLGPTENNGVGVAPAKLHIALVVPDVKTFNLIRNHVFVVVPPLWKGEVALHVIPDSPKSRWHGFDWVIRQALVDTGLVEPNDVEFSPPVELTLGWPTTRS